MGKVILVSYQLNFLPARLSIIPDHRFGWSMLSLREILRVASPIPVGIVSDQNKKNDKKHIRNTRKTRKILTLLEPIYKEIRPRWHRKKSENILE